MRWSRTSSVSARSARIAAALLCILIMTGSSRPASAYIDPGTGGVVFGSLAPILGMVGVLLIGVLGFGWAYTRRVLSVLWRHRLWAALALVGTGAAVVVLVLRNREERPQAAEVLAAGPASKQSGRGARRDKRATAAGKRTSHGAPQRPRVRYYRDEKRPAESFRLFADYEFPAIERRKYELDYQTRSCFVFDRDGSVEKEIVPEQNHRLAFCVGADFSEQGEMHDSVQFLLSAVGDDGEPELLIEREWDKERAEWRWTPVSVDLEPYAGRPVTLRFEVLMHGGGPSDGSGPVCLVSDPRLEGAQEAGRPNVILFSIETLRRDHLSLYGYGRKTSPFLEELAKEAIVFEDAYSQSSWTKPSVGSMLTGLYPSQHGAVTVLDKLDDSLVSLAEILRERGYVTAGFCTGRVVSTPLFNYDQGFDVFADERSSVGEEVRQDIVAWLDAEARGSFFLFVHLYDPHTPYNAPGRFRDGFDLQYDGPLKRHANVTARGVRKRGEEISARDRQYVLARYDGEILYVDAVLSSLVEDLQDRGLWDNTLLLVTSDHGEEFNEHGGWTHGQDLYPETLRVPLIMKLPGQTHGGRRVHGPAGHVDIMPTLLSAVGVPAPEHLLGVDLLKSFQNRGRTPREHHLAELYRARVTAGDPIHFEIFSVHRSVISDRYQYIWRHNIGARSSKEYLFDLVEDWLAQDDLAGSRQGVLQEHASLLHERYGHVGYTMVVNGGGEADKFTGTVRSEAQIVQVGGLRTESDDSFLLGDDGTALRFELTVANDDDALYFQTEPENAALTIIVERDRVRLSPELVRLGPKKEACRELPVAIPAEKCAVDANFGDAAEYSVGTEPGVFIWRQSMPRTWRKQQATPDQETLGALKNLGYL